MEKAGAFPKLGGTGEAPPPHLGPPHSSLPPPFPVSVYFPNYSDFSCFVPGNLARILGAGQLAGGPGGWEGVEAGGVEAAVGVKGKPEIQFGYMCGG